MRAIDRNLPRSSFLDGNLKDLMSSMFMTGLNISLFNGACGKFPGERFRAA